MGRKAIGRSAGICLAVLALSGCATAVERQSVSSDARRTVAVVGTPFFLVGKVVACVGTTALAGPLSAVNHLAAPQWEVAENDRRLAGAVTRACSGPYVLTDAS